MNIRMYKDGDYEAIEDCIEPFGKVGYFEDIKDRGVYLTVEDNNKVIGCGGVVMTTDDEGVVWLTLSYDIAEKKLTLIRLLKEGLKIILESFNLKRITAKIQEGYEKGERMARWFGFRPTDEVVKAFTLNYRTYEL